jgi:hypothetical protein
MNTAMLSLAVKKTMHAISFLLESCLESREGSSSEQYSHVCSGELTRLDLYQHVVDLTYINMVYSCCGRGNAFLDVSIFIAKFDEYRHAMCDFLVRDCTNTPAR